MSGSRKPIAFGLKSYTWSACEMDMSPARVSIPSRGHRRPRDRGHWRSIFLGKLCFEGELKSKRQDCGMALHSVNFTRLDFGVISDLTPTEREAWMDALGLTARRVRSTSPMLWNLWVGLSSCTGVLHMLKMWSRVSISAIFPVT
jgi:hypothetical protein